MRSPRRRGGRGRVRLANAGQIREERGFQEKLWTAQSIGWVLMLLFVIAALLGATGSGGPLSMARAQSGQATVDYPRIARWQASTQMIVTLAPSATGQADLYLPQSLLDVERSLARSRRAAEDAFRAEREVRR